MASSSRVCRILFEVGPKSRAGVSRPGRAGKANDEWHSQRRNSPRLPAPSPLTATRDRRNAVRTQKDNDSIVRGKKKSHGRHALTSCFHVHCHQIEEDNLKPNSISQKDGRNHFPWPHQCAQKSSLTHPRRHVVFVALILSVSTAVEDHSTDLIVSRI